MKIKKYEAQTEQAAIEMVKNELGLDAIVLNIKKIQPKGIFALFRKPIVEITAAYEERALPVKPNAKDTIQAGVAQPKISGQKDANKNASKTDSNGTGDFGSKNDSNNTSDVDGKNDSANKGNKNISNDSTPTMPSGIDITISDDLATQTSDNEFNFVLKDITISEQQVKIRDLENQLQSSEQALSRMSRRLMHSTQNADRKSKKYNAGIVQMFYETMSECGVIDEICELILDEIDMVSDIEDIDINIIVKIVYNSLISLLEGSDPPNPQRVDKKLTQTAVYAFIGSTGVGKTTTIAKLAAEYMLNRGLNVGLITADTYRIAAVEQLKLYGDILGIEVRVVYNTEELTEHIKLLSGINDVILVDTAGRSHKNHAAIDDLSLLISLARDERIEECKVFLVLSLTTKYEDLLSIIDTYSQFTDFQIIFTKWDETTQIGSIINIIYKTGKTVAYITTGQNVPQDFEELMPEKVARALLGLGELGDD